MLADPVFRVTLLLSVAAHVAIIGPHVFFNEQNVEEQKELIELNYIVIKDPVLVEDEEVYSPDDHSNEINDEEYDDIVEGVEHGAISESYEVVEGLSENAQLIYEEEAEDKEKFVEEKEMEKAYLEYFSLIREKIRGKLHSGSNIDKNGIVYANFTISPVGKLLDVYRVTSDISPEVRRRTIQGIKRAQPFPPFPEELGHNPINFSLTIKYGSE